MSIILNTSTVVPFSSNDLDGYNRLLNISYSIYDGNVSNMIVDFKTKGTYNAVSSTNANTVDYEINDVAATLPFTLNEGDKFSVQIDRTLDEVVVYVILTNSTDTYSNMVMDFYFDGKTYNNVNSNYDSENYLIDIDSNTAGTYTRIIEESNIAWYLFEVDSGAGFAEVSFPFTVVDTDIIRLNITKNNIDDPAFITISPTTGESICNLSKSVYGFTPYCSPPFNGINNYCTVPNDTTLPINLGSETTLGGWFNTSSNTNQVLFSCIDGVDTRGWYIKLKSGTTGTKIQFQMFDEVSNSVDIETEELALNQWWYYSIVKTGDTANDYQIKIGDKTLRTIYDATITINSDQSLNLVNSTSGITIGKDFDATNYFVGFMDNMHKIDRACTDKEVEIYFNYGWAGNAYSVLRAEYDYYYKISRLNNPTFTDFGLNGNDVTLVNFASNVRYFRETLTPIS